MVATVLSRSPSTNHGVARRIGGDRPPTLGPEEAWNAYDHHRLSARRRSACSSVADTRRDVHHPEVLLMGRGVLWLPDCAPETRA